MARYVSRIRLSLLRATKRGAWTKVISAEMEGLERDLRNDVNRQLFGWGNGVLGTTNGTGSGVTALVMDTGHAIKANMVLESFTATSGGSTGITNQTVSAVSAMQSRSPVLSRGPMLSMSIAKVLAAMR